MNHSRQRRVTACALVLLTTWPASQAQSHWSRPDVANDSKWTARFEVDSRPLLSLPSAFSATQPIAQTLYLYNDYQFSSWRLGTEGGLRLTSGLIFSTRASNLSQPGSESPAATPYAGIGYRLGNANTAWGWNADLGITTHNPERPRLGRTNGTNSEFSSNASLAPHIRLGVQMKF